VQLESQIKESIGQARRLLLITDGIFSMRGDYAPLDKISDLCKKYEPEFPEGIILMVDDSHGVGAFGQTGRGTEEYTHADRVDILIGTLGKAFGVNGGYVVAGKPIIDYLREKSVTYIYSNPITTGEAAATIKALDFVESTEGKNRLAHIRELTKRFKHGLKRLGFETLAGEHPIVPLLVRHTDKTTALVHFLLENGVLSTGIKYPVVPRGDEEIRFQVNGNHTAFDIDTVLEILDRYKKKK
jgi:glycine C-acetyltransferase